MAVPKYKELFNSTLQALKKLGGSASIEELNGEVTSNLNLTEADIVEPHGPNDRQSELDYQLAWSRTYLKSFGLIDNAGRGIWIVTPRGQETEMIDAREIVRYVRQSRKTKQQPTESSSAGTQMLVPVAAEAVLEQSWKDQLLTTLRSMAPDAFERLCQRLLRESGFVEVKVTGRTGDGGIDGVGRVKIGGLLGFPIVFQCKRYQGSVGSNVVREFRGAMMGRADRGLILTTGTFTRDARQEATRDGVPPIDLLDGDELMDKLKELRLGVTVQMIEEVGVDTHWFGAI
ncbi:MAG: restriction endonuclease [Chloroflexota bacterium]|nr:restriction endonuclease [Chloroflexota bacterium]